jgi:hypothetical protein
MLALPGVLHLKKILTRLLLEIVLLLLQFLDLGVHVSPLLSIFLKLVFKSSQFFIVLGEHAFQLVLIILLYLGSIALNLFHFSNLCRLGLLYLLVLVLEILLNGNNSLLELLVLAFDLLYGFLHLVDDMLIALFHRSYTLGLLLLLL